MVKIVLLVCIIVLLHPVSRGSPTGLMNNVIIHEVDMKDLDLTEESQSSEQPAKRLYPDHKRLCAAKECRINSKEAFKGRFSENAIILPRTFEMVSCEKGNQTSQSSRGMHCLGVMDCQETTVSKYFVVVDFSRRISDRRLGHRIVKLNSVPVECSCFWPRSLGRGPHVFFNRCHN